MEISNTAQAYTSKIEVLSPAFQQRMMEKKTWHPSCPVALDRLRRVIFTYVDFQGQVHHDGEIVVMDAVATAVAKIFQQLYHLHFPLQCAKSMEHFDGDDDKALNANNTSAFNFRPIANTTTISLHGYGLAIDVNPIQNPYIGYAIPHSEKDCMVMQVWPKAAVPYVGRAHQRPGMVEPLVDIFATHGFRIWGGYFSKWGGSDETIDLHHFQTPRWLAELLVEKDPDMAERIFNFYLAHPDLNDKESLLQKFTYS